MADRALDKAGVAWSVPLAALLGFDAALVRGGHPSMSDHAGRHRVVTGTLLVYLALHLLHPRCARHIAHLDPLAAACRWLERNRP